jgi:hypothetical protein
MQCDMHACMQGNVEMGELDLTIGAGWDIKRIESKYIA